MFYSGVVDKRQQVLKKTTEVAFELHKVNFNSTLVT